MKKNFITFLFIIICVSVYAQPAGKWATTGNSISSGDFIGTTNNASFDFRVNNVQQMSLGTSGILTLNSLSGIGNRVLITDANGNITALPSNVSNALSAWDSNGGNVYLKTGNLGIGTTSPSYKLDVVGDARISNNLYVGGGIIVTDKLDAAVHVKAGDVIVNNDLNVTGNSKLLGSLTAQQGIMFDATNGLKMYSGNSIAPDVFTFGRISPTGPPVTVNPCFAPSQDPWFFYGGRIQTFDAGSNTALTMGSDGVQSAIEHSGNNGLLINYYCGKNIYLGTGSGPGGTGAGKAGAKVYTGDEFYARKNVQIGVQYQAIDPNVVLNVFDINNQGIKLWPANQNVKLISDNLNQFVVMGDGRTEINTTTSVEAFKISGYNGSSYSKNFVVEGTGKTTIHIQNPTATDKVLHIIDDFNNKDIFLVKSNGKTYAREVEISLINSFPDYVFNNSYELMKISELDTYIKSNKHLPGFERAEHYEKNGINVNEMFIKQQEKIEELTLYIIELENRLKKIEELRD